MKKRFAAGLIIAAMGLALAACGSRNKEAEVSEPAVQEEATDAEEEEIYESAYMSNPWVDSDYEGVLEATGFDLTAPDGSANIAYSYMPETGMAQLNFVMDNSICVYRAQHTEALEDISGVYCDWDYVEDITVAGHQAMEFGYASEPEGDTIDDVDYTRVLNWFDANDKTTYCFVIMGKDLNGMDTAVYVENLLLLGAPESDGVGPISDEEAAAYNDADGYKAFLGLHVNSYDGSDILVEEGENGRLNVNVSIFRLCELESSTGIFEFDVVSFSATDPNGNVIRCCLYYNSDNSLCMEVEDSSWDLLPTGTIIEGFDD